MHTLSSSVTFLQVEIFQEFSRIGAWIMRFAFWFCKVGVAQGAGQQAILEKQAWTWITRTISTRTSPQVRTALGTWPGNLCHIRATKARFWVSQGALPTGFSRETKH